MSALQTEYSRAAVATAPLPELRVKPKLQPLAGLAAHSPAHSQTVGQPNNAPPPPFPAYEPQHVKTTVFAAENRPNSPWSGPVTARSSPVDAAKTVREIGTPAPMPDEDDGIDGVRKLIFGRHMTELQTKVAELQMALSGEIKRLREALMSRVDEMAGYLHRDMVVLREETLHEINHLKTDLFTAATSLSGLRDRLSRVETKTLEETRAALADIDSRITRQEGAFATALENIEAKLMASIDSRCADALAVLAKKSDLAEVLSKMGTLLEEPAHARDSSWIAPVTETVKVAGTWSALAEAPAPTGNPFLDQSLIA